MKLSSIPDSWLGKKLDDVASVRTGDGAPQEASAFSDHGIPFVRAGSLSFLLNGGTEAELERLNQKEVQSRRMTIFPPGTVVFAKSGMSCTKGLIYQLKGPCCVVNHLAAVDCSRSIDSRFLVRWFERNSPARLIENESYPSIKISAIRDLELPLPHKNGKPDLDEQKRIAAILDKADAIRRKRQQALRLTDDFLRSVFLDLFGDPVTNPKGWDTTTVGEELEFLTSGSRGWAQYYAENGDYFIRIQNLRGGMLDLSDSAYVQAPDSAEARRTRVQPGDVLLSITADLGRTAVVPEGFGKGYINQHLAILRLKRMNPVFVSQQLASPGGQRQFVALNRSAVKAGLNFDDVRSISLLRPPSELQEHFADIVAKLEKRQGVLNNSTDESDDLFASLQQRAFRGEL